MRERPPAEGARQRTGAQRAQFVRLAATGDPEIRATLVTENLGLARSLARRFTHRGEAYEDLVQVASVALIHAVDRFDPGRGVEFSTFATRTILGELKRHLRDKGWAVRAPRRVQERYLEASAAVDSLTQALGRSSTVAELAAATGSTEEEILEAIEAGHAYRATSIDAVERPEQALADRLGSNDHRLEAVDERAAVAPAMRRLTEREREILRLRFIDGLSQSEIARRVGVSQMHVSRLLSRSLATLRSCLRDRAAAET